MSIKKKWDDRPSILIKCDYCNVEFKKTLSEHKRSEKKSGKHFCSLDCHQKSRIVKNKKCPQCGETLSFEMRHNKFCSKECRSKSLIEWNKNRKGEKRNFSAEGLKNIIETTNQRFGQFIDQYHLSPNHCKECGVDLPYIKRGRVFCGIDCKRKYDRRNMSKYQIYWQQCQFKFSLKEYPEDFDFTLIEQHGWYSPTNKNDNLGGVSRDHRYSVREGFENNIPPEIIKHPANCQLMKHTDNISKNRNSDITIEELEINITRWNEKYGPVDNVNWYS